MQFYREQLFCAFCVSVWLSLKRTFFQKTDNTHTHTKRTAHNQTFTRSQKNMYTGTKTPSNVISLIVHFQLYVKQNKQ